MNQMLSANNTIVYDNMKSEREIITTATALAVAQKVDIAVSSAVARALTAHAVSTAASPVQAWKEAKRLCSKNDAVMENSAMEK
jgi:hypothetical protein